MVLTQRIVGLSLKVLSNHRGSSMNLGFQSVHGVLTREFLSSTKKESKPILQTKIINQRT